MQIFIRAWFTIVLAAWSVVEAKAVDDSPPMYFGVTAYRQAYKLGEAHRAARLALTKIKSTPGQIVFYSLHFEPGVQRYMHAPETNLVEARGLMVSRFKSPRTPHLLDQVLLSFKTTTGFTKQQILLTRADFYISPTANNRKFILRRSSADRILKAFDAENEWDQPARIEFDLFASDNYRYFTFRPGRMMLNQLQVETEKQKPCVSPLVAP